MTTTVLLYGHLAQKYGKRHEFEISSPGEAMRALKANYPDFEKAVLDHSGGYHVLVGFEERIGPGINDVMSSREVIRIVPSVAGSGIETIATWLIANAGFGTVAAYVTATVISVGISIAISGIASALLAPDKPKAGDSERAENKPSYLFNGPVNTTAQGHPVAVGYGRLRIGSQVISAGLSVEQIPL